MDYYKSIKEELINNELNSKVKNYSINISDLNTYYNVGKILAQAGKHYGDGIITEYSRKLINEVNRKYNITNLKRMRQFYYMIEKGATLWHQLTWSHYKLLIPLDSIEKINYYGMITIQKAYSVRQLELSIKNKEYERLPEGTKRKIMIKEERKVDDLVKNPILIKNNSKNNNISEKLLQKLILEDIESFMKELGNSLSFIGSEYKIKIGNTYNYIDLLFFNIEFNCYVIVELKVTELKKEHIGQIEVYMNYIDNNLRRINQDKTIGIIITKKDNKYIIEYSSDERIISRQYELV